MLSLLATPAIRVGLVVAFVVGLFGTGYLMGKRAADQTARIEELERDARDLKRERDTANAQRDEANRLMKAANDVAKAAAEREQAAQAENDELEGMVREYETSLKKEADRGCGFTAADVERLRAIYERAFGALQPAGTPRAPGVDGAAGPGGAASRGK